MNRAISLLSLFTLSVALAACSGSRQPRPGSLEAPTIAVAAPLAMPAPSVLAEQLEPVTRGASYSPSDLVKGGNEYRKTLPHQRVVEAGSDATFTPAWTAGAADLSGLAYAMFDFTIEGYEGDALFSYPLGTPQTPFEDVYIGLANWDTDVWSWYPGEADFRLELPSIDPFLAFGGKLLLCVAIAGDIPIGLEDIRIGSLPPHVLLGSDSGQGVTPWTVTFDASSSTDPDGTIVEYRWDGELNGQFTTSTGSDPTHTITMTDAMDMTMFVRAIDDTGIYDTASADVIARAPEIFTYGSPEGQEYIQAATVDPDNDLVFWGSRTATADSNLSNIMRMELYASGQIDVSLWDGPGTDLLLDACDDGFGGAWTCGSTDSYGQGGNDGLIQHWDRDGLLLDTWVIGLPVTDQGFTAIAADDLGVYVTCNQFDEAAILYSAYVLRVSPFTGGVQWCRQFKSAKTVSLDDMVLASGNLHVCGTYTPTAGDTDALYMHLSALDGSTQTQSFMGNTTDDERATSVLYGNAALPGVWVAGTISTSGPDHSFVGTPGGMVHEVVADFSMQFSAFRLLQGPRAPLTLVLTRRETLTASSIVLADFDNTLQVMPTSMEFGATPGGQAYPLGAMPYGSNGLLVCGFNHGALPVPLAPGINAVATARPWHPEPIVIEDQTMLLAFPDLEPHTGGATFARDRAAADGDALVILRDYNALPST